MASPFGPLEDPVRDRIRQMLSDGASLAEIADVIFDAHIYVLAARVAASFGSQVQAGPFLGMGIALDHVGNSPGAKLIGSYEAELHEPMGRLITSNPSVILNVGSGDGYYAVGLARALPAAQVHAFDLDPVARSRTRETAQINGVGDRINVCTNCTHDSFIPHALIVCDIEGAELELLNPVAASSLLTCSLLVELHDNVDPSISRQMVARFSPSHDIQLVPQSARDPAHYPALAGFTEFERAMMLCEFRDKPMQWAVMTPLDRNRG